MSSPLQATKSLVTHPLVPSLILFSFVTSCALNRARLARTETESQRRHATQIGFLRDQLGSLSRSAIQRSEEIPLVMKRCNAIGIDPLSIGFRADQIPAGMTISRTRQLTWTDALMGRSEGEAGPGLMDQLKEGVARAAGGLKGQFGGSGPRPSIEDIQSDHLQTAEAQDEWEKGECSTPQQSRYSLSRFTMLIVLIFAVRLALIESLSSVEENERKQREERLREEEERRQEYARASREAYIKQYQQLADKEAPETVVTPRRRTMI